MRIPSSVLPALAVTLAVVPALAQPPRTITLEEAVEMAVRNAPPMIQARGQSRATAAAARAAYAAFLPTLGLSAGATRQLPAGNRTRVENGQVITLSEDPWSSSIGLGATLELFVGGRRLFDVRQARARAAAARINEQSERFNVTLAVKQRFFDVLAARESQAAAAAQLEQAEQQRRTATARTHAHVATRSDSLRAEIQVRNARLAVIEAQNDLDAANASLTARRDRASRSRRPSPIRRQARPSRPMRPSCARWQRAAPAFSRRKRLAMRRTPRGGHRGRITCHP
jgi:outer membrane protein